MSVLCVCLRVVGRIESPNLGLSSSFRVLVHFFFFFCPVFFSHWLLVFVFVRVFCFLFFFLSFLFFFVKRKENERRVFVLQTSDDMKRSRGLALLNVNWWIVFFSDYYYSIVLMCAIVQFFFARPLATTKEMMHNTIMFIIIRRNINDLFRLS